MSLNNLISLIIKFSNACVVDIVNTTLLNDEFRAANIANALIVFLIQLKITDKIMIMQDSFDVIKKQSS